MSRGRESWPAGRTDDDDDDDEDDEYGGGETEGDSFVEPSVLASFRRTPPTRWDVSISPSLSPSRFKFTMRRACAVFFRLRGFLPHSSFVRSFGRSFVCLFFRHEKLRARHVERWEAHDADRPEQRSGEIRPRDARQVRRAGEDLGRGVRRRSARNIIIAHFYPPTLSSPPPTPSPTSISLVLSTPPPPARRTSERTI